MNKYYLLFLILILFSVPILSIAQKDTLLIEEPKTNQFHGIKLSLAHFMMPAIPGVFFDFEHSGKNGYYWRHQAGTFLNLNYADQKAIEHLSGIGLRSGVRKYKSRKLASSTSSFREFSISYRYLDLLIGGDFRNSGFSKRINYNMWQHSSSLDFIWGQSARIGSHWQFDLGIGLGLRVNRRSFSPISDDNIFSTNGSAYLWRYGVREGWHTTLSVPLIFSLAYVW